MTLGLQNFIVSKRGPRWPQAKPL